MRKILVAFLLAAVSVGCVSTPSNVVCSGNSKDFTCQARVVQAEPTGHRVVDVGR